jgi:hypothetical protein
VKLNGTFQPLVYTNGSVLDRSINGIKDDTATMLVARKEVGVEADTVNSVMFISLHSQDREPAIVVFVKDTNKWKLRS